VEFLMIQLLNGAGLRVVGVPARDRPSIIFGITRAVNFAHGSSHIGPYRVRPLPLPCREVYVAGGRIE
jgi:hypothetical protein